MGRPPRLTQALVAAALLWPLVMAGALWMRATGRGSSWVGVYAAASVICHQRPERSFHTGGVQWPVCGRCAGLYLAAPIGVAAAFRRRAWRTFDVARARRWLAIASVPTAASLGAEWMGDVLRVSPAVPHVTNLVRFIAAWPLGAVIACILIGASAGEPKSIE